MELSLWLVLLVGGVLILLVVLLIAAVSAIGFLCNCLPRWDR